MYAISAEVLNLLCGSHEEHITIMVNPVTGASFTLTEDDIKENTIRLERHCVTGQTIEIGAASASELSFRINNNIGNYKNVVFEGAELIVKFNVKAVGSTVNNYIPIGYFTVDEVSKDRFTINIVAIDRMVHFDKDYSNTLVYPATVRDIITNACTACNVNCATILTTLPNYNYAVEKPPSGKDLTYRNIIMWCAEITGTCAYIDWDGKLRFEWYNDSTTVISAYERYTSKVFEKDVIVSGVDSVHGDVTTPLASGSGTYRLTIEENQLIQGSGALSYTNVLGTKYRPYDCTTKNFPHLYPLDKITFIDANGNSIPTIITHVEWKFRGRTTLKAAGISEVKSGYSRINPLTAKEKNIIDTIAKDAAEQAVNQQLTQMEQATLLLNEMMFNSLGLYYTSVDDGEGGRIVYAHDSPELEESSTIYTMKAQGYAYTNNGWNNGNPVWQYGFDKDGNAIYKSLSVYNLSADLINAGTMTADHIKGGSLVLGGANNEDGILQVKNAAGNVIVQADKDGLSAIAGVIGGMTLASNALYRVNATWGASGGMYFGVNGLSLSDKFKVDPNGTLSSSNAIITGGYIDVTSSGSETPVITVKYASLPAMLSKLSPFGLYVTSPVYSSASGSIEEYGSYASTNLTLESRTSGGATLSKFLIDFLESTAGVPAEVNITNGYIIINNPSTRRRMELNNTDLNILGGGDTIIQGGGGLFVLGGTKSKAEETDDFGTRLLYCYEMPSPMYGDIGGGELDDDGICYVDIDPIFAETLEKTFEYYVFLQKYGDGDIYVSERNKGYFVVRGTPNMKFAWELKGKQKGYNMDRLEEYDFSEKPDNENVQQFMNIADNMFDEILYEYERILAE